MANLSNINGKFVVEQTTGYVGVGTEDPNYPIEVLNASAEIALNSSGGSIYRLRSDSTDAFRINKNGVGDRLVILSDGKVGIGTDSPTSKLTIDNGSASGGSLLKSSNSSYTAHFIANTGTGNAGIYMDAMDGDFIGSNYGFIGQNNAGFMEYTVSPSSPLPYHYFAQNVGIGVTSPGYPLDVASVEVAARFTGSQTGHTQGAILLSSGTADTPQARGQGVYRFNEGNDETWYTGTAYANTNRYIWARKSSTTSFDSSAAQLTYAMMSLTNDGKLGIGVTSPFSRLQSGSHTFSGGNGMAADSRVGISNHGLLTGMMLASTYNDPTYPEYGLVFVQGPDTSNYNVWSISPDCPAKGDSLNFIYGSNATNIHVTSPKVVFDGNGNVGIGIASPTSKLHVVGGATNSQHIIRGPYTVGISGTGVGNSTLSFAYNFNGFFNTGYAIEVYALFNHWSSGTANYTYCYRKGVFMGYNAAGGTEILGPGGGVSDSVNVGAWTFSVDNNGSTGYAQRILINKSAGNAGWNGTYWVQIVCSVPLDPTDVS